MANGDETPKVDLAYLLSKYGTKSGKKKPVNEPDDGKPKKPEYKDHGFCIQFRLSRAYKQIARQEIDAAKPVVSIFHNGYSFSLDNQCLLSVT